MHDQRNRRAGGECVSRRSGGGAGGAQEQLWAEDRSPAGAFVSDEGEAEGAVGAAETAEVGANTFAQEAGIHQDGIIKNPETYEIISPEMVGVPARSLVLGKHSGRNALQVSLRELGYEASDAELADVYGRVTALADQSKQVRPRDLMAIAHEVIRRKPAAMAEAATPGA